MKKICLFIISLFIFSFFSCKVSASEDQNGSITYLDKAPTQTCLGYKKIPQTANLTSAMSDSNMIYDISYEFDLHGANLSIPQDSILIFSNGGCIKNGSLNFNKTYLDGFVKFENTSFSGTLLNKTVNLSWFGVAATISQENAASRKNSIIISEVIECMGDTLIVDGFFPISSIITIDRGISFRSPDWNESKCSKTYNSNYTPTNGFFTNGSNVSCFTFTNSGSLNMYGILIRGDVNKYQNATTYTSNADNLTFAFILPWTGSIATVYNCKIEGFTQGIRALGGFIEKIQNTTFNACDVGLYALYASDFDIFGCSFTNCMGNYSLPSNLSSLKNATDENLNNLRQVGCGFICEGCGMVNCANNYFDNNFIHMLINEGDIIINISECNFTNPGFCDLYFYNDYQGVRGSFYFTLGQADLQKYCIDNIVVNNNTFTRSKKALGGCVALFKNKNRALGSTRQVVSNDRVTNVVFSNNTINDTRTSTSDDESIFFVSNVEQTKSRITCSDNKFTNSKAKYFSTLISGSSGTYTFINRNNVLNSAMSSHPLNSNTNDVIVLQN